MALNQQPLLSIAIPTYNRAVFLDRALNSIYSQIHNKDYPIEIIVSNNDSQDSTEVVVEKYINLGLLINYIKNPTNMGPDFNILQCFKKAKGKYIVVFGDDDLFNDGAIARILFILNEYKDIGIFYMNWKLVSDENYLKSTVSEIYVYEDYTGFFDYINQSITFISGVIVNASYVNEINFDAYQKTYLIQVPFFLKAAFSCKYNIIHQEPLISVQPENSGGYSFSKVFGENISKIFDDFNSNPKKDKIFKKIKIRLLMENFPIWIYRTKTQKNTYTDSPDIHKVLSPVYNKFCAYWFFVYPVIIMPAKLTKLLWPIYRVYKVTLRLLIITFARSSNLGKSTVYLEFHDKLIS